MSRAIEIARAGLIFLTAYALLAVMAIAVFGVFFGDLLPTGVVLGILGVALLLAMFVRYLYWRDAKWRSAHPEELAAERAKWEAERSLPP